MSFCSRFYILSFTFRFSQSHGIEDSDRFANQKEIPSHISRRFRHIKQVSIFIIFFFFLGHKFRLLFIIVFVNYFFFFLLFLRVVSAVQAALSCVTGSIVCMWSCTRSFLHASHFMSEAYAWFGASYFFYDIWSMYRVHASITQHKKEQKSDAGHIVNVRLYLKEQPVIVMHHLFIGSFGFLIIVVSLLPVI